MSVIIFRFIIIFNWFLCFPQHLLFYRLLLLLLLPVGKAVDLNRLGKKLPCRVNIFETENKTSAALPTVGCASSTLITVAQVGRFEFLAGITKNAKSRNRRRRRRWQSNSGSIYIYLYLYIYNASLFPFAASSKRNRIFSQPQKAASLRIFFNYLCFANIYALLLRLLFYRFTN